MLGSTDFENFYQHLFGHCSATILKKPHKNSLEEGARTTKNIDVADQNERSVGCLLAATLQL